MPKLFKMDNFEDCTEISHGTANYPKQYCIVNVNIDPSKRSKILDEISKFSTSPNHFNHKKSLKYGICLSNCLMLNELLGSKFTNYLNDMRTIVDDSYAQGRLNLMNKLMNVCINKQLLDYHGLMAESSIDYCIYDELAEIGPIDELFILSFLSLIFIISSSAVFDYYKTHSIIGKRLENWRRVGRYFSAFSIKQNWQAFISNENSSDLELDNDDEKAAKICVVKIVLMFLFVLNQAYRQITSMPFANPIYVEKVSEF